MSRFEHIEIGKKDLIPPRDPQGGGVVDEHFYMEGAEEALLNEDYERSLGYHSRALQYDVSIEDAWLGQLRCLIGLNELQEAIIWFGRAIERFPNSAPILAARGVTESRLGRTGEAMKYVDAAFSAQGITPYVWVARGEILIPVNATSAKACFSKALELSSRHWSVYAWIGAAYQLHGDHHQAMTNLRNAVRDAPDRFMCWYRIGQCHESMAETDEAQTAYRRALSIQPSCVPAREGLTRLENRGTSDRIVDGIRRLFGRRGA